MVPLAPSDKVAQVLLVRTLKVSAVTLEESPHAAGRYWVSIQPLLLKKQQTQQSSWTIRNKGRRIEYDVFPIMERYGWESCIYKKLNISVFFLIFRNRK